MRELLFDTETTGLDPNDDRIVSLALVETLRKEPTGRFVHFYFNPQRYSSPGALAVHKLDDAFLATKPFFKDCAASILDFIAGAPLVAHNARFDVGFLNAEMFRAGRSGYVGRYHCTKCDAQKKFGGTRGYRLDDLVARFGIRDLRKEAGRHGALIDTLLLLQVYRRLEGLPEYPVDLSNYMVDGNETEQATGSKDVSAIPQPDAPADSVSSGQGSDGASEELQRDDRLHHADATGRPESASPAT